MMRRSLPSPRVTSRVRQVLENLGYIEHTDFSYEVEIRAYGNRRFLADLILFDGEVPIALIEVEGSRKETQTGFDEARLKAIAYNPEDPVPILWIAAGDYDQCYLAERPNDHSGIRYVLTEHTPNELLDPSKISHLLSAYLERQKGQSPGELQYRLLLENTFASLPSKMSPKERIQQIAEVLLGNAPSRHRALKELARRIQPLNLPQVSLAHAFRHLMRYYFRPSRSENDPIKQYGIYFTPYEVIQFLVDLVAPRPCEKVVDPACGSGGFLAQVITHLVEKHQAAPHQIAPYILGCDIHDTCVKASRTVVHLMLTEGRINPAVDSIVRHTNSLNDLGTESFDIVLCNPPAGPIPGQFGYQFVEKLKRYEVAFLEMVLRIAKKGARIGLVLPEGLLANTNTEGVRRWVSEVATIEAIVGLPRGLFPFTPSRMCAVIMTKHTPTKRHCALLKEVSRYRIREQFQEIKRILRNR